MDKHNFDSFIKSLKNVTEVRDERRSRMREFLSEFADMNPAREGSPERYKKQGKTSFLFALTHKRYMGAIASLLILFAAGGGAAFAAEGAVPGDLLYGFKTEINESVKSALEVGAENDAEWDIRQAERRVQEAIRLSESGELENDTRVRLEERFALHADHALALADKLEEKGNVEAASRIRTSLEVRAEAYDSVLALLEGEVESSNMQGLRLAIGNVARGNANTEAASVGLMMRAETAADASVAADDGVEAEEQELAQVSATVDIEAYIEEVAEAIEDAQDVVRKAEGRLTTAAEAHLKNAENAYARAEAEIEAGVNERSIQAHLEQAYRQAIKAEVMAENSRFLPEQNEDEEASTSEDTSEVRSNVDLPVDARGNGRANIDVGAEGRTNAGSAAGTRHESEGYAEGEMDTDGGEMQIELNTQSDMGVSL